ncbi:MAG: VOC family protein [Rhodospirillaceae bacterium]|nr:VOC family protein [Rhodospirillaceae bacterium]
MTDHHTTDHHATDPFHLAIPVHDLKAARAFYGDVMGCPEGRSSDHWIDYDLFGHQLVVHLSDQVKAHPDHTNPVDGHDVPVPHFGVVLTMARFETLAEKLRKVGVKFVIEPYTRFKGEPGEQATMFFRDPSGNAIEFKAFANRQQLFAK